MVRHRPQGIAVGKHGDHNLATGRRVGRAAGDHHAVNRNLAQIKAGDPVPGCRQIGRHRPAHIAKSDEADIHHHTLLSRMAFLPCLGLFTPVRD